MPTLQGKSGIPIRGRAVHQGGGKPPAPDPRKPIAEIVTAVKGPRRAREDDRALIGFDDEVGPGLVEVLLQPGDRPLANGDYAVLLALARADDGDAAGEIEVVEASPISSIRRRPVELARLQERAVAQPDRCRRVGVGQHLGGLGVGERLRQPLRRHPRQLELGRRVRWKRALLGQLGKQALHGDEPAVPTRPTPKRPRPAIHRPGPGPPGLRRRAVVLRRTQ